MSISVSMLPSVWIYRVLPENLEELDGKTFIGHLEFGFVLFVVDYKVGVQ